MATITVTTSKTVKKLQVPPHNNGLKKRPKVIRKWLVPNKQTKLTIKVFSL